MNVHQLSFVSLVQPEAGKHPVYHKHSTDACESVRSNEDMADGRRDDFLKVSLAVGCQQQADGGAGECCLQNEKWTWLDCD